MKRSTWSAVAGLGVVGLIVAAPAARADERTQSSTSQTTRPTASDTTKSGTKSEPGTTATDTDKTGRTPSDESSAARGSGMGGTSTGARPGTGTAQSGSSSRTTQAFTGRVEKFDRGTRTLSLANSDKKLKLTDDTEVMKDGQKVSPGQIMEGDEVRASLSGSGDTLRVDRLEVVTPARTGGAASGAATSGTPPGPRPGTASETGQKSSSGAPGDSKP